MGGGGSVRGLRGGFTPGGFFDSSRRIFRRIFLADFSFVFCDQKNRKIHHSVESSCFRNPPALRHQKFTGLPPPPRESKSKSCAFGSGTVTFQGGSFQEKTPGLIGPRNLRILIGRIAVGWPCMECHVPYHISIYWVWDSVKQSEGWGKKPALIARSPTRHSKLFIEKFHHQSSLLVWLPNTFESLLGHFNSFCVSVYPPRRKCSETSSPTTPRIFLRNFERRLWQNYVITKKSIPKGRFCVIDGSSMLSYAKFT